MLTALNTNNVSYIFCALVDMVTDAVPWAEANMNKWISKINVKKEMNRAEIKMILEKMSRLTESISDESKEAIVALRNSFDLIYSLNENEIKLLNDSLSPSLRRWIYVQKNPQIHHILQNLTYNLKVNESIDELILFMKQNQSLMIITLNLDFDWR
jgi:hypothetical protein